MPPLSNPDWFNHLLRQCGLVLPELWLAVGAAAVLMAAMLGGGRRLAGFAVAVVAVAGGLASAVGSLGQPAVLAFGPDLADTRAGVLAIDPFSQMVKVLILAFVALVLAQWWLTDREGTAEGDVPDFLCLMLGGTFGMLLMASATNLLVIVIAIESASLPSYVLAGFRKRSRTGAEGALKYVVFGSAASAVSVYGMSLLYALTGTLDLGALASEVATHGWSPLLAIGLGAFLLGIAFKLSAVPMHFWCPDVFEAAPTAVTTFLSVASKGAAVALLVRVLGAFGAAMPGGDASAEVGTHGLVIAVAVVGAVTATWGNLAALGQTQIKRLLAYSSIAQAGYMIMAIAPLAAPSTLIDPGPIVWAVLFYLMVYLFMNGGAFTCAAVIEASAQGTGRSATDIAGPAYLGLARRDPLLAVLLSLFLLSLFGMPGLGGFLGKIYLMKSMAQSPAGFVLIVVLLLNTLLSLYYYMRPVYYMVLRGDSPEHSAISAAGRSSPGRVGLLTGPTGLLLIGCAAAVVWTGLDLGASALVGDHARVLAPSGPSGVVADSEAMGADQAMPRAAPVTSRSRVR